MSDLPTIITPQLIRRHNWRCFGRMVLWGLGSLSVFLVVFLFVWVLLMLFLGWRDFSSWVFGFGSLVTVLIFSAGAWHLKKHGPQDWERIAQKPDRKPGMRLSRMSNQEYGQIGQGFLALILAGPGWLIRMREEWRAIIPAKAEVAGELEALRTNLAARESWVPMRDFSSHEAQIYLLTKLEILAIREILGEWYFRVTVQGATRRSEDVK